MRVRKLTLKNDRLFVNHYLEGSNLYTDNVEHFEKSSTFLAQRFLTFLYSRLSCDGVTQGAKFSSFLSRIGGILLTVFDKNHLG